MKILNQTLPKNLNTIILEGEVTISDSSLESLMNSWEGPRPINIKLFSSRHLGLLKKYQDLGFLKII